MSKHVPVLLNECIEGLNINPSGIYVDCTLGRGGHSKEILKRLTTGRLIAFDQDENAIKESKENLKDYLDKVTFINENFSNIEQVLINENAPLVDGVLMDLGVSSPQFDDITRGFSYQGDAVLDMRMDLRQNFTAKDIVNTYSLEKLCEIFRLYSDEKYAYNIAKNIIKEREKKEIVTTSELVEIIKRSKPSKELSKIGHPAKQVFQALRIETNDEYGALNKGLSDALRHLKIGGRICVITFHSGEDRIVKNIFKNLTVIEGNRINLPDEEKSIDYELVNRHPIVPSEEEISENHRAKSAKLRIITKIK